MEADVAKVIVDPVCGIAVSPDTAAASREYSGTTYYFCSASCAASFDADPGHYASTAAQG